MLPSHPWLPFGRTSIAFGQDLMALTRANVTSSVHFKLVCVHDQRAYRWWCDILPTLASSLWLHECGAFGSLEASERGGGSASTHPSRLEPEVQLLSSSNFIDGLNCPLDPFEIVKRVGSSFFALWVPGIVTSVAGCLTARSPPSSALSP